MNQGSPCYNCPDRRGLECKKTCRKWAEFEKQKENAYKNRQKSYDEKDAVVQSRLRTMKKGGRK